MRGTSVNGCFVVQLVDRSRPARLHMQTNGTLRAASRRAPVNGGGGGDSGCGGLLTLRNVAASIPLKGVPWSEAPSGAALTKASAVTPGFVSRKQLNSSMRRRRANDNGSVDNSLTATDVDFEIPSGDLAALRSGTRTACCKLECVKLAIDSCVRNGWISDAVC